jgi:hypothetical protein
MPLNQTFEYQFPSDKLPSTQTCCLSLMAASIAISCRYPLSTWQAVPAAISLLSGFSDSRVAAAAKYPVH